MRGRPTDPPPRQLRLGPGRVCAGLPNHEWDVELYGELLEIGGGKERMTKYFQVPHHMRGVFESGLERGGGGRQGQGEPWCHGALEARGRGKGGGVFCAIVCRRSLAGRMHQTRLPLNHPCS